MSGIGIGIGIGKIKGSSKPNGSPSNLVLTVDSDTAITGSFDSTSTNQDGYYAYISADGGVTFSKVTSNIVWNSERNFTVSGLTQGATYYLYVIAYKGSKESTPSNTVSVATLNVSDLNLWIKSRSGLTMPDTISGNDATINPAYLYKPLSTSGTASVADPDNLLDIGASDFFFAMWVKNEDTVKTANAVFGGKYVTGNVSGAYGFQRLPTSGYLRAQVKNSTTTYTIDSTIDFLANGPYFLYLDVNQATHKFRFFINNIQIGSDLSCPGIFSNLDSMFHFTIGSGLATLTGAGQYLAKSSHSDTYLGHFIPSADEMLIMYNRTFDATFEAKLQAHWPILGGGKLICDCSGNGLHLNQTGVNVALTDIANTRFGSFGSTYGLNVGFTLYENGYEKIYVPLKYDGTEIIPTFDSTIIGYKKTPEGVHAGNATKHNLANSTITIIGSSWDRSNTTIWGDLTRDVNTWYNSSFVNDWHVTELNNIKLQSLANTDYKGLNFVKVSDHSYKSRKLLNEVLSFATNKTGVSYTSVVEGYCRDYTFVDTYENDYVYWKPQADSIIASNGLKQLKWVDAATDVLSLSIDGGLTFPYSANSPFNGEIPTFAEILDNGNILVAGKRVMYISTNNLTSIAQTVVKDIAGNDYTAASDYCFSRIFPTGFKVSGMLIWPVYNVLVQHTNTDMNIWYSIDNGVTIKSAYKANVTNPPLLNERHFHGIALNPADGSFWVSSGDQNTGATTELNILKGVYDIGDDTWAWSALYTGNNFDYKWANFEFNGTDLIVIDDNTVNSVHSGVWKCAVADLGDSANFVNKFKTPLLSPDLASPNAFVSNGEIIGTLKFVANQNVLISSTNRDIELVGNALYGLNNGVVALVNITKPNDWYLCHYLLNDLTIAQFVNEKHLKNGVVWVKLK